jgi:hypothetical protein
VNLYIEGLSRQFQLDLPLRDKQWSPTKSGQSQSEQCVERIKYLVYNAPQRLNDLVADFAAMVPSSTDRLALLHQLLNPLIPPIRSGKGGAVTQNDTSSLSRYYHPHRDALSPLQSAETSTEQGITAVQQVTTPNMEYEEWETPQESHCVDTKRRNLQEQSARPKKRGSDNDLGKAHSTKLCRLADTGRVSGYMSTFQTAALSSPTTLETENINTIGSTTSANIPASQPFGSTVGSSLMHGGLITANTSLSTDALGPGHDLRLSPSYERFPTLSYHTVSESHDTHRRSSRSPNTPSNSEYSYLCTQAKEQLVKLDPSDPLPEPTLVPTTSPTGGMNAVQLNLLVNQFPLSTSEPEKNINEKSKIKSDVHEKSQTHIPEQYQIRDFPGQGLFFDDSKDPSRASELLFRVRYECARLALANGLDPHALIPQPGSEFDDYDTLISSIKALKSVRSDKLDLKIPGRVSSKAWKASTRKFSEVSMKARLSFNENSIGPLFKLLLEPLQIEKSCRFQRAFGGDRFLCDDSKSGEVSDPFKEPRTELQTALR